MKNGSIPFAMVASALAFALLSSCTADDRCSSGEFDLLLLSSLRIDGVALFGDSEGIEASLGPAHRIESLDQFVYHKFYFDGYSLFFLEQNGSLRPVSIAFDEPRDGIFAINDVVFENADYTARRLAKDYVCSFGFAKAKYESLDSVLLVRFKSELDTVHPMMHFRGGKLRVLQF